MRVARMVLAMVGAFGLGTFLAYLLERSGLPHLATPVGAGLFVLLVGVIIGAECKDTAGRRP